MVDYKYIQKYLLDLKTKYSVQSIIFMILCYLENGVQFLLKQFRKQYTSDNSTLFYFDFETTGLNVYHDKIIEYAFIREDMSDINQIPSTIISSLVNPEVKFDKKITDITGIHPDELEDKNPIDRHMSSILSCLELSSDTSNTEHIYFVAHNCYNFDIYFLKRIFPKKRNWKFIDTLLLAKKLLPNQNGFSQSTLSKDLNIQDGTHRATSDAICLRVLYHTLLDILAKQTNKPQSFYLNHPDRVVEFIKVT